MGRLIDADELVRNILSQTIINETDAKIMDRYLYCVNNQPTAYDVDKVVEELELLKKYNNRYDSYYDESMYRATEFENYVNNDVVKKSIEIVRNGGVVNEQID